MEMVKLMIIYVELYVSKKKIKKKIIWLVFFLRIIVLQSVSFDQEKR